MQLVFGAGRRFAIPVALLAACFLKGEAAAFDTIVVDDGRYRGTVTKVTPLEVVYLGHVNTHVLVVEIRVIYFDGEPKGLRDARHLLSEGDLEKALALITEVDREALDRDVVAQDVQYTHAACVAKLFLKGGTDGDTAENMLRAFLKDHPSSWRYCHVHKLLAEVLIRRGKFEQATALLKIYEKAPHLEYRRFAKQQLRKIESLRDE